jgi:hypothetical protein
MEGLLHAVLKGIAYVFNASAHWLRARGSDRWLFANATVTAPPVSSSGFGCPSVEIVYSYRFKGELYTGIHEEPFLLADSVTDYVERFGEGRSLVVRVKPDSPKVSVVREGDQGALVGERLTS